MTRRGYVAAALGALVAFVVPLAMAAPGLRTHTLTGEPATSPQLLEARGDDATAAGLTCAEGADPPESLPLSGTVQAARLCATHPRYERWTAPEPLVDDLDVLAESLARLEPAPEDYLCFQSGGGHHFDLRLVVDGRVVSLATQPSCLEFTVAGADFLDTGSVFDAFLAGLTTQRARRDPPELEATSALDCNPGEPWQGYALSPLGEPVDMVEAVSCWRLDAKGDVGPRHDAVPVPPKALALLVEDMRSHHRRDLGFDQDPCAGQRWYEQDLLGRTAWGDVVVARGVCDTSLITKVDGAPEDMDFWYPSPRAQRILDRLHG